MKQGLTPMTATIILVVVSLLMGSTVMAFGKDYVKNLPDEAPKKATVCIKASDEPLKQLQTDYLQGKITKSEYISRERAIIR